MKAGRDQKGKGEGFLGFWMIWAPGCQVFAGAESLKGEGSLDNGGAGVGGVHWAGGAATL